jgi:integrase
MTTLALKLLQEAKAIASSEFVVEYGGERVLSIKKGFGHTAKRAGLPWVTPNVLRHSAAIWMAEGGTRMEEISQFLGHSSTRVTEKVYARFSPTYLRKASSHLEL